MEAELRELRYADGTRERLVAAAELAARADAAGDVDAAAQAKAIETRIARELGQHQHAVVACAELIERWPQLAERGELSDDAKRMVIWGLKYGAGSAMDLPEIPLSTVEEVIAHLERVLGHVGREPWAAWELDARRAFIAGDDERVRARVAAIGPTIGRTSHAWQDTDCPGCTLLAFADYLGAEARPEEVEAVLAPVLAPDSSSARFPADAPEMVTVLDLLYGDDPICDNARATTPVKLARAYARHGRVAEARREAERALARARGREPERMLRAQVAALEVAAARRALDEIAPLAEAALPIATGLEDAYERLDAALALHAAIGLLGSQATLRAELPRLAADARAIARRLDGRLARPRHVAATERALA